MQNANNLPRSGLTQMATATGQFSESMRGCAITPPEHIITDGKIHRFASNGKQCDDAGWYVFYDGNIPAGAFGCWRSGLSRTWYADIGRQFSPQEEGEYKKRLQSIRRAQECEKKARHNEAKTKAENILSNAPLAGENHPYLEGKKVKSYGLYIHDGDLVVPAGASSAELQTLQFISADGAKRFLYGGQVKGCFHLIGEPEGVLCIAEGYATAATIYEATGYATIVAFNAGNLPAVARGIRQKYPDICLVICADDDWKTKDNPGLAKATEAARATGGLLAIPAFESDRHDKATDFNDMAGLYGIETVTRIITAVTDKADVTGVTDVQASKTADSSVTADVTAGENDVPPDVERMVPDEKGRPCYRVFDEWVEEGKKYRPGVWHFAVKDTEKNGMVLTSQWICTPLHIEAVTFDAQDNNFGRLLRFLNPHKRWREWAMPMELLKGSGEELRGELLAMGVEIDPHSKGLLATYLQSQHPKRRMRCAQQVGWCEGSFVLPDTVIGDKASGVIFQSGERDDGEYTCAGTLDDWKTGIAVRAIGNPMLTTALSGAFAGPLLQKCNAESGGLHYVDDSSVGKTGLIDAACSVWGGENYKRSWKATANGMEGVAALFNDGLLTLDEISECEPREVGAIVYSLGNGRGKQRASKTGNARSVKRWRCFVLSSGERTIETTMAEGGCRIKAGQHMRLPSIPVARKFGVWDALHGIESGSAFTDAIKSTAKTHYGYAGRAYLERLTRDNRDFCALWERTKALPEFAIPGVEGQEKRVAGRFALVAIAGELATEYGLTGWPEGEAINAASIGLKAWLSTRSGCGNDEKRQVLESVSAFLQRHGDARFSNADATNQDVIQIRDRAGWWRNEDKKRTYFFTAEGLREALKGFDFKRALDELQKASVLSPADKSGERAKLQRIGGRPIKLYHIHADKLEVDHGA